MTDEEHIAELEAQLAARTRRLEDTDAALVACERSRDQAKDALAERTRERDEALERVQIEAEARHDAQRGRTFQGQRAIAAEAALAERTRDCETLKEEILRQDALLRAVEQDRDHWRRYFERD